MEKAKENLTVISSTTRKIVVQAVLNIMERDSFLAQVAESIDDTDAYVTPKVIEEIVAQIFHKIDCMDLR